MIGPGPRERPQAIKQRNVAQDRALTTISWLRTPSCRVGAFVSPARSSVLFPHLRESSMRTTTGNVTPLGYEGPLKTVLVATTESRRRSRWIDPPVFVFLS